MAIALKTAIACSGTAASQADRSVEFEIRNGRHRRVGGR
jgi:hypothetical protein